MPLGGGGDGEEIYKSMQGSILSNLINKITVTQSITNLIVFWMHTLIQKIQTIDMCLQLSVINV